MRELYRANATGMPMIAHNLLGGFRFNCITVVERFHPVWTILGVLDYLVLLGERKIKVRPAVEPYRLYGENAKLVQPIVIVETENAVTDNCYVLLKRLKICLYSFAWSPTWHSATAITAPRQQLCAPVLDVV